VSAWLTKSLGLLEPLKVRLGYKENKNYVGSEALPTSIKEKESPRA